VVLAGGGTAGHVLPALAVADALVAGGRSAPSILFVGSRRGQETQLVPPAGYALWDLPGRGLLRRLTPANLLALAGLLAALAICLWRFARQRPRVVVCLGGYAALAPSLAGLMLGVAVVVVNLDAVPGATIRLVSRFSKSCATAWEGSGLPNAVVTGLPLRREILAARAGGRQAAREALGIPDRRRLVLVMGGSLGSARINAAAQSLAEIWARRSDLVLRHVVGRRDWAAKAPLSISPHPLGLDYQPVEYEPGMALWLAAADLVVARAGAGTIAELAAMARPAVLVPLPGSPGDHQTANAELIVGQGGAVLLADADCDGPALAALGEVLLSDPEGLEAMGAAAAKLAKLAASEDVAALVEAAAKAR
jgi:UDP-N-acetylglucosamine--N-acetylmuramyl-(pentapeptide) pyrophosphoryl-undecaprenol N-acetylglucosamine transferase